MTDDTQAPDYLGHRQRLRTKVLDGNAAGFADYELLEFLLTYAVPRRDMKPLAKQLIKKYGSFAAVVNAPKSELLEFSGLKENSAALLMVVCESLRRAAWQQLSGSDAPIIANSEALLDYCRTAVSFSEVEELHIIFLDSKLRVIGKEMLQRGSINCVAIHPREIVKAALARHAKSIIMIHNHPSGDVRPSKCDLEATKQTAEACHVVDVKLQEHLIISRSSHFSFKDHGLLPLDFKVL